MQATTKKDSLPKEAVKAYIIKQKITTENNDPARELYNQSRYGRLLPDGRVQLSFIETMYLLEKQKIRLYSQPGKEVEPETFLKKAVRAEQNFWTKYCVFRDIRDRGYIIKTALKFGADFRIYDRGVKPGEDHARWVLYATHERERMTWQDFSAKNRVAHSTKKRLLIGVVDDEGDVSYWEARWLRP